MKKSNGILALAAATAMACGAVAADVGGLPSWAYVPLPQRPANAPPPAPDPTPKRVPGSDVALTMAQIRNLYKAPDWHPGDHPPMPDIVALGREPGVFACAYCHLPNGLGRPENASVAGLPAAYIIQQVADFKSGARKSADGKLVPPIMMSTLSKTVSDADVRAAAEYFASLKLTPWITVIETDRAPRTRVGGAMLVVEGREKEPIGQRIIEVPDDLTRTELRDSQSGFTAYVPEGSIKKGEALVSTGNGKLTACAVCHGADLRGLGPIPALAGRSPSYLVRQLYDFKTGARAGAWSALMKDVAAKLSEEDIVNVAAYAASRAP